MNKKTLVLGASNNPERYSYLAVNKLLHHGYEVAAIGKKESEIAGIRILVNHPSLENIHTVTLYLNAKNQEAYYDYIIALKPKRVIFNPGAENRSFAKMLSGKGIEPVEACTLVLLSTNQF